MFKKYKLFIEALSLTLSFSIAKIVAQNKHVIDLLENINGTPLSYTMRLVLLTLIWLLVIILPYTIYLRFKDKKFPRFGVYWDIKRHAYCPACKNLLSNYDGDYNLDPHFYCSTCDNNVHLFDEKGRKMFLKQAVHFLFKRKITEKAIQKFNNRKE